MQWFPSRYKSIYARAGFDRRRKLKVHQNRFGMRLFGLKINKNYFLPRMFHTASHISGTNMHFRFKDMVVWFFVGARFVSNYRHSGFEQVIRNVACRVSFVFRAPSGNITAGAGRHVAITQARQANGRNCWTLLHWRLEFYQSNVVQCLQQSRQLLKLNCVRENFFFQAKMIFRLLKYSSEIGNLIGWSKREP